jgi:hypothetical protein
MGESSLLNAAVTNALTKNLRVASGKLSLIVIIVLALAFSACEQPDNPVHEHQWGEWTVSAYGGCYQSVTYKQL